MYSRSLFGVTALVSSVLAQSSRTSGSGITIQNSATTSLPDYATGPVTYNTNDSPSSLNTVYTYTSGSSVITRTESSARTTSVAFTNNSTVTSASTSTGSFVLSGTIQPSSNTVSGTLTGNATATSGASQPTNTVPCNGYPELCNRKYSNITHVAAHNSPFIRQNNLASNQMLDVTYQLNDGIRMLQFQVHYVNESLYLCHTSCDLLNVGTLTSYLTTVREWLDNNQYDVVTILMGNYDVIDPQNFTTPIIDSGIINYVYTPPTVPMELDAWPTLGEMILNNERVVVMLDYEANQSEIPWLLDEFSYMWETPFSPTDREFPCTADRPPDKEQSVYGNRMNMANHNLNVDITLAGLSILVPATNVVNETNAVSGYGSAGWAVQNCTRDWNRPPTFLLVDYYNIGNFNGSVFAVAAAANNVTYDDSSCCGVAARNAGGRLSSSRKTVLAVVAALSACVLMI